jgi:hypothetical protein
MTPLKLSRLLLFATVATVCYSCIKDHELPEEPQIPRLGTCQPVLPKGRLTYIASQNAYQYVTSGGGVIKISGSTVTCTFNEKITVQFWGGPAEPGTGMRHENLNGKHIKDWLGTTRSFIFPDGSKITYAINPGNKRTMSISIYDRDQAHHINSLCDDSVEGSTTLEYSETNSVIAALLDKAQPDGETATLEVIEKGVLYLNIYTEDEPGKRVEKRVPLGTTGDDNNPKQVNDLYDDERLAHT